MSKTGFIYGTGANPSVTKDILREQNKNAQNLSYWNTLERDIMQSAMDQSLLAKNVYEQAKMDAYIANRDSEQALMNSTIATGEKFSMRDYYKDILSSAYDAARIDYGTSLQKVQSSAATALQNVDKQLSSQAKYTTDIWNKTYDYLKHLDDEGLTEDVKFSKYYKDVVDEEGTVIGKELLGRSALFESLIDEQGNLTSKGSQYMDMLMDNGYLEYLVDKDTTGELTQWLQSQNIYDKSGLSNLDYVKRLYGITEGKYDMFKYADSLTDDEIQNYMSTMDPESRAEYIANNPYLTDEQKSELSSTYNIDLKTGKTSLPTEYSKYIKNPEIEGNSFNTSDVLTAGTTNETFKEYFPKDFRWNKNQEDWINKVLDAAKNGQIANGTIVDFDYDAGGENYMYYNGNWYKTSDENDDTISNRHVYDERDFDKALVRSGYSDTVQSDNKKFAENKDLFGTNVNNVNLLGNGEKLDTIVKIGNIDYDVEIKRENDGSLKYEMDGHSYTSDGFNEYVKQLKNTSQSIKTKLYTNPAFKTLTDDDLLTISNLKPHTQMNYHTDNGIIINGKRYYDVVFEHTGGGIRYTVDGKNWVNI